jgi:hypothetical protein
MYDSIARNNNVHDEDRRIFLSQPINNKIHENDVSNCETGIKYFIILLIMQFITRQLLSPQ